MSQLKAGKEVVSNTVVGLTSNSSMTAFRSAQVQPKPDDTIKKLPRFYAKTHELVREIPVHFEEVEGGVIAHLREAGLSMSGTTRVGAKRNLLAWIIDTYDDLDPTGPLSVELEEQFFVVAGFIRRRT